MSITKKRYTSVVGDEALVEVDGVNITIYVSGDFNVSNLTLDAYTNKAFSHQEYDDKIKKIVNQLFITDTISRMEIKDGCKMKLELKKALRINDDIINHAVDSVLSNMGFSREALDNPESVD